MGRTAPVAAVLAAALLASGCWLARDTTVCESDDDCPYTMECNANRCVHRPGYQRCGPPQYNLPSCPEGTYCDESVATCLPITPDGGGDDADRDAGEDLEEDLPDAQEDAGEDVAEVGEDVVEEPDLVEDAVEDAPLDVADDAPEDTAADGTEDTEPDEGGDTDLLDGGDQGGDLDVVEEPDGDLPLAAPTGVTASDATSADTVRVQWNPVAGATSYRVLRDSEEIASGVTETSYDDEGAEAFPPSNTGFSLAASQGTRVSSVSLQWHAPEVPLGTVHSYSVVAENGSGSSPPSVSDSGRRAGPPVTGYTIRRDGEEIASGEAGTTYLDTTADAGGAPTNVGFDLTASQGERSDVVRLTWSAPAIAPGTTHTYTVQAENAVGLGDPSASASGWRGGPAISSYQIVRDAETIASGVATPTWDDATASASVPGSDVSLVASQGTSAAQVELSWQVPSVAEGTHYDYQVVAVNSVGPGPASSAAEGWRGAPEVTSYTVRRGGTVIAEDLAATAFGDTGAAPGGTPTEVGIGLVASDGEHEDFVRLSWSAPEVTPGPDQSYTVQAVNAAGEGPESAEATGYRAGPPVESYGVRRDGELLAAGVTDTTYDDDTAAATVPGNDLSLVASQGTSVDVVELTWQAPTLSEGTHHSYEIVAVNSAGPGPASTADAGWRQAAPVTSYTVWRGTDEIASGVVATTYTDTGADPGGVPTNVGVGLAASDGSDPDVVHLTWSVPDVTPGTAHEYTVAAVNVAGAGEASAPASGWRAGPPVESYKIVRDDATLVSGITETTFDDATAAATVPGTDMALTASQGTSVDAVELTWQAPTLSEGTHYSYEIVAVNSVGEGPPSAADAGWRQAAPVTSYTLLQGGVELAAGLTATSYTDLAAAPGGAPTNSGFNVVATDGLHFDFVELTWSEPTVTPGAARTYTVRATNAVGTGPDSPEATGWRAGPPVETYDVLRDGDPIATGLTETSVDDLSPEATVPGNDLSLTASQGTSTDQVDLSWQAPTVSEGVHHNYQVVASNAAGDGPPSTGDAGWRQAAPVTGYVVLRGGVEIATDVAATSYADTGADPGGVPLSTGIGVAGSDGTYADTVRLTWSAPAVEPGTAHAYTVLAVNDAGRGDESAEASGWRAGTPVESYVVVRDDAEYATGVTETTWDDPSPEATVPGNDVSLTASQGASTDQVDLSWQAPTVSEGVHHNYQIVAVNSAGPGSASAGDTGWRQAAPVTGYDVLRDGGVIAPNLAATSYADTGADPGGTPTNNGIGLVASDGTETGFVRLTWSAPPVTPGTTHTYTVRALNDGGTGLESTEALGWRSGEPVDSYEVLRSDLQDPVATGLTATTYDDSTAFAPVPGNDVSLTASQGTSTDVVSLSWQAPTVGDGTAYEYKVVAVNAAGPGTPSASDTGWRGAPPVTGYAVVRDGVDELASGLTGTTYDDDTAVAFTPSNSGINLQATDATRVNDVRLTWSEPPVADGMDHTYQVVATNSEGPGDASAEAHGWRAASPVTGYVVRRGTAVLATDLDALTFDDTGASVSPPSNTGFNLAASDGTRLDAVELTWSAPSVPPGPYHDYTVAAVNAIGEGPESVIMQGRRAPSPITGYELQADGGTWVEVGLTTSYVDASAPAGVVNPGTTVASDGTNVFGVDLSLTGVGTAPGATVSYRVRAVNAAGPGVQSTPQSGYRGEPTIMAYAWQWLSDPVQDEWTFLHQSTAAPYTDATAPSDGTPRTYQCRIGSTAPGSVYSVPDDGSQGFLTLVGSDTEAGDWFGYDLQFDDGLLAVFARFRTETGAGVGAFYTFELEDPDTWSESGLIPAPSGTALHDEFALDWSSTTVLLAAQTDDDVVVFSRSSGSPWGTLSNVGLPANATDFSPGLELVGTALYFGTLDDATGEDSSLRIYRVSPPVELGRVAETDADYREIGAHVVGETNWVLAGLRPPQVFDKDADWAAVDVRERAFGRGCVDAQGGGRYIYFDTALDRPVVRAEDTPGTWVEEDELRAHEGWDRCALAEKTAIMAASAGLRPDLHFYRSENGSWLLHEEIGSPTGDTTERFGEAVSLYGNWLAVGAPNSSGSGSFAGAVYVYWLGD